MKREVVCWLLLCESSYSWQQGLPNTGRRPFAQPPVRGVLDAFGVADMDASLGVAVVAAGVVGALYSHHLERDTTTGLEEHTPETTTLETTTPTGPSNAEIDLDMKAIFDQAVMEAVIELQDEVKGRPSETVLSDEPTISSGQAAVEELESVPAEPIEESIDGSFELMDSETDGTEMIVSVPDSESELESELSLQTESYSLDLDSWEENDAFTASAEESPQVNVITDYGATEGVIEEEEKEDALVTLETGSQSSAFEAFLNSEEESFSLLPTQDSNNSEPTGGITVEESESPSTPLEPERQLSAFESFLNSDEESFDLAPSQLEATDLNEPWAVLETTDETVQEAETETNEPSAFQAFLDSDEESFQSGDSVTDIAVASDGFAEDMAPPPKTEVDDGLTDSIRQYIQQRAREQTLERMDQVKQERLARLEHEELMKYAAAAAEQEEMESSTDTDLTEESDEEMPSNTDESLESVTSHAPAPEPVLLLPKISIPMDMAVSSNEGCKELAVHHKKSTLRPSIRALMKSRSILIVAAGVVLVRRLVITWMGRGLI